MTFTKIREKFNSNKVRALLIIVGGLIVALFIFQAGMIVGFHKARFDMRSGNEYYRAFDKKQKMSPWNISPKEFSGGHGVVGKVIKTEYPRIVVADRENVEKVVVIASSTEVRKFRDKIDPHMIQPDDFTVILGNPNEQGEVSAKFIRILPPPETKDMMRHATGTVSFHR